MKVLVTGGTGLVGAAAVDRLLAAGHTVRLLSRHAADDARRWPRGVEPWEGDVTSEARVRGAAEGCDAVLHTVGIVAEAPPEATYQRVNVEGTRCVALEARRAGVRRFVYVSSLGAERGESDYHRSKAAGEAAVREVAPPGWLIVRPGNVYGPGDGVISLLLRLHRSLPVVPTIGWGDQPFQPAWHEDVGEALARAVTATEPAGTALDLAGPEVTTTGEVLDLLAELTDTRAVHLPVPALAARLGTRAAEALGIELPVNSSQITMLGERNVLPEGTPNALTEVFGVTPTPLREGLRRLASELPAQLPSGGSGALHRERYWADVEGGSMAADALFDLVCTRFAELPLDGLLRVGAEPGSPVTLEVGNTLALAVPLRGHVQVRVAEVARRTATLVTVEGHFLAGAVRFLVGVADAATPAEDRPPAGRVRFEVRSYFRAATLPDRVAMAMGGAAAQSVNWSGFVEEVVRRTGGTAPEGVQHEHDTLSEEEAARVETWVKELVLRLQRDGAPPAAGG